MNIINGTIARSANSGNLKEFVDQNVTVKGVVSRVRNLGGIFFLILVDECGVMQCVLESKSNLVNSGLLKKGTWLEVTGKVVPRQCVQSGFEIQVNNMKSLSSVSSVLCESGNPDNHLTSTSRQRLQLFNLRSLKKRAIFRIKDGIKEAFCEFLKDHNFTGIDSPKIIFVGTQGGSKLFSVDYFGKCGYLTQSPQLYKQMMVAVFHKVFEVSPVFRANENISSRQLNEFVSLDVEFGPIYDLDDVTNLIVALIKHILQHIRYEYQSEIDLLKVNVPILNGIPSIFDKEAEEIVTSAKRQGKNQGIRDSQIISVHSLKEWGSEFILVTHPPLSQCPFYTLDDPNVPGCGRSFNLIFRGLSIANGGQRIHSYLDQRKRIIELGLDISEFDDFLMAHFYGLPPHGGFAISLERFVMRLLALSNIREASLFPRDKTSGAL